ncbi:conserved membrane hypothetical protein [Tenacibaculum sp. 190524A02b]|uniref:Uncharacterized protein n=1 Tax=Tenacibaculum vairaonense TaxID=3137860 RepID=A0ABP1FAU0_9FLAO
MKLKTQETRITSLDKVKILFLSSILIISITSPFWHIYFEKNATDGIFGFRSFRSFLYSFGTHFILFGFSVFMYWVLQLIPNLNDKIKTAKYIANIGIGMYCAVSIYYLLYIFINTSNSPYPDYFYEIAFTSVSLLSSFIIYQVFKQLERTKEAVRKNEDERKKFVETSLEFIKEINESIAK